MGLVCLLYCIFVYFSLSRHFSEGECFIFKKPPRLARRMKLSRRLRSLSLENPHQAGEPNIIRPIIVNNEDNDNTVVLTFFQLPLVPCYDLLSWSLSGSKTK